MKNAGGFQKKVSRQRIISKSVEARCFEREGGDIWMMRVLQNPERLQRLKPEVKCTKGKNKGFQLENLPQSTKFKTLIREKMENAIIMNPYLRIVTLA